MDRFREKKSFTLIKLIGSISILATVTYPMAKTAINHFYRAKAANNMRIIALAHGQFISDFGRAITFSELKNISGNDSCHVNSFAAILAKYGYIEDVSVWAWDFDYKVKVYGSDHSKIFPEEIYDQSTGKIHINFQGKKFPLSVVCSVVQCPNFDYKTLLKGKYPAAYSRGLKANGYWLESSTNDKGGVFGRKGGLIAYYDGTVEWCENTINKFITYSNQTKTSHICEAIPNAHGSMEQDGEMPSNFLDWIGPDACDL